MSQRQTDPGFEPSSQDPAPENTSAGSACALEAERSPNEPPGPEHPDFDPYKFSRVSVSPELRRQLVQARLPRLDPDYLQDTLPPNRGPDAGPSSNDFLLAPAQRRRRHAGVLVALCLLGGALLLALAFKSKLVARPPAAVVRPVVSAPSHLAASQASAPERALALPTPSPGVLGSTEASAPPPAQASLRRLADAPSFIARQSKQAVSVSAMSAFPTAATASAAPVVASAAPASPSLKPSIVSPTPWFDYKK